YSWPLAAAQGSGPRGARTDAARQPGGGEDLEVAGKLVPLAPTWVPRLSPMIEAVHRRHLAQAGRRFTLWELPATETSTVFAVIGFADMGGFTARTQELSPAALDEFVRAFEDIVLATLTTAEARLVKLIGDEAMFVAGTAADAARIAAGILEGVAENRDLPPVKIGLAAGEVLVREGGSFGPAVNRAARLVAVADPGTVVVDAEVASRLDGDAIEPLGPRELPGFDAPVEIFRVCG